MQKRKVRKLTVVWDNGESDEFVVDATFSESINARKKAGFQNIEEWVEYHITWVTYVRDLPSVEPRKSPEEIEKEAYAVSMEKKKNPLYAGTQDGRDFYKKLPPNWEQLFNDIMTGGENGNK